MNLFDQRCKQAGLRVTPQRLEVYKTLCKCTCHPTTEEIYQYVRKTMPHISYDTVNRTLNTFCKIGAAFIVEGSAGVKRYDGNLDGHPHFKCINCKRIFDFSCETFDNIVVPDEIKGRFLVLRKTIYLEGLCDECNNEGKSSY